LILRLRAGLDHGEKVHQSKNLGQWSNIIGYIMDSSLIGVYIMAKGFAVDNF
jgi:hypothetical protein